MASVKEITLSVVLSLIAVIAIPAQAAPHANHPAVQAERKDLRQDATRLDRHLYNQKYDAQTASGNLIFVGTRDPGVNQRQRDQRGRIAQGVRSGELTKAEAKSLATEQKAIRQEERAYKADGVLTPAERRDLRQDQKAASKNIYQQKHDADKR